MEIGNRIKNMQKKLQSDCCNMLGLRNKNRKILLNSAECEIRMPVLWTTCKITASEKENIPVLRNKRYLHMNYKLDENKTENFGKKMVNSPFYYLD